MKIRSSTVVWRILCASALTWGTALAAGDGYSFENDSAYATVSSKVAQVSYGESIITAMSSKVMAVLMDVVTKQVQKYIPSASLNLKEPSHEGVGDVVPADEPCGTCGIASSSRNKEVYQLVSVIGRGIQEGIDPTREHIALGSSQIDLLAQTLGVSSVSITQALAQGETVDRLITKYGKTTGEVLDFLKRATSTQAGLSKEVNSVRLGSSSDASANTHELTYVSGQADSSNGARIMRFFDGVAKFFGLR